MCASSRISSSVYSYIKSLREQLDTHLNETIFAPYRVIGNCLLALAFLDYITMFPQVMYLYIGLFGKQYTIIFIAFVSLSSALFAFIGTRFIRYSDIIMMNRSNKTKLEKFMQDAYDCIDEILHKEGMYFYWKFEDIEETNTDIRFTGKKNKINKTSRLWTVGKVVILNNPSEEEFRLIEQCKQSLDKSSDQSVSIISPINGESPTSIAQPQQRHDYRPRVLIPPPYNPSPAGTDLSAPLRPKSPIQYKLSPLLPEIQEIHIGEPVDNSCISDV